MSLLASLPLIPGFLVVAGLVLKVTIMVAIGALVAGTLRNASAAVRHFVWTLTLGGVVALTLATPFAPPVAVRLASWPASGAEWSVATPIGASSATSDGSIGNAAAERTTRGPSWSSGLGSPRASSVLTPPTSRPIGWPRIGELLGALWLLGALAVVAWCALGHIALAGLARAATPLASRQWQSLLESVAADCGVTRHVRLLRAPAAHSPVTWGMRRPIVLLPDDAEAWSVEHRRVVLGHELAHVARNDYLAQLMACAACVLYWFHPLAWIATRRLRLESERACDDHVLARGTPGAEYAGHLLDVARRCRELGAGGMLAIGMAQKSQLEGRLLAVLDETRPRQAPRRRATAWATLALVVLPLAALRIAPRAAIAAPRSNDFATRAELGDADFEREVKASPGERLLIDLETGGDVDLKGWDQPTVRIRGHFDGGPDWRDTRVSLERDGRHVRFHSWQAVRRHSSSTSHRFEIRVPRRFDVKLSSAGGDVTLADLEGEFDGHTGGGAITIERVRGLASLSTGGGDIHVDDVDLSGSVSTGGGQVTLSRVRGSLHGSSGSGPVIREDRGENETGDLRDLTIDDEGIHAKKRTGATERTGRLQIHKSGGEIVLDSAPAGAEISTGGGSIHVGPSAGFVDASTGGGDIEIGPVSGSVHASTGAGHVGVTIAGDDGVERSVDVSSGRGSVVLELPPGLAARFDLETAYTDNFGRRTRINSEWNLEREETTHWDDHQGTPRKYVRARGEFGGGGGLIRVRIVNGDITVRKAKAHRPSRP